MDPVHAAAALFIGLYLGWLAERAAHIRLSMGVHILNNAAAFALARTLGGPWHNTALDAILLAASVLTGAAAIALLRRMRPETAAEPSTVEQNAPALPSA
jgi:hypothetical protein